MSVRTGGEWVVDGLVAEGVRHVFGIPGVHNLAIYDALLRPDSGIAHILARHEQGAAFMADGYARSSGRPGVVVVTTGPGATNVLTPLVESYAGSQPVLALMSDIPAALIGRDVGALHEVPNQIDCFRPVCRRAEAIRDGADFAPAVQGAFELFRSGRPGPVALLLRDRAKDLGQVAGERHAVFRGGDVGDAIHPRLLRGIGEHLDGQLGLPGQAPDRGDLGLDLLDHPGLLGREVAAQGAVDQELRVRVLAVKT